MKKSIFFVYLFAVIFGVAVIDVLVRQVFTPIFENPPINSKASATYKFVSHTEPTTLAIFGASRANHHYRSEQIEDSLGLSVYNYGWDGRCILYQYLCLLSAIKNGDLKMVLLDLSEAQLSDKWVVERISDLYPYYWSNRDVCEIVDRVEGNIIKFFMTSALVQYNSQYLNFLAYIEDVKGYSPLAYTGKALDLTELRTDKGEMKYNEIALFYLKRISQVCKEKNIDVIVCLSPSLSVSKESEERLQKICDKFDLDVWNYTRLITDPSLFSDYEHLNDKGAEVFTGEVINRIKKISYAL